MSISYSLAVLLLIGASAAAQAISEKPVLVVPDVDLNRYMGRWYEIARLPNSFQRKCVSDVTATYTLQDDGTVQVVNRCRMEDGEFSEVTGKARRATTEGPNSKLEVRFAPSWLSFLPFVWGDYWIIVLAPDYSYAAIGDPDRKYLWILARTPSLDETTMQKIMAQIKENGYDLADLQRTKNEGK